MELAGNKFKVCCFCACVSEFSTLFAVIELSVKFFVDRFPEMGRGAF